MTFTAFDILAWMIIYLNYFIVAKIVIRDKTLNLKEGIYIIAASLSMAVGAVISINIINISGTINSIALPVFCMIYFYKIKFYSLIKALILTFFPIFIIAVNSNLIIVVINFFFPYFLPSIPNFPLPIGLSLSYFLQFAPYMLFTYIFSILTTFLFVKATKKQRRLISQSDRSQRTLAGISILVIFTIVTVAGVWRYIGAPTEFLFWLTISLIGVVITTLASVVTYVRYLREQMALNQKEAEQRIQQQYTQQIEQQQTAMRKFKHDYQNILLSVDGFVKEENWNGLKQYMSKVSTASDIITNGEFALENLSKIKPPEIKGLLTAKLLAAQNTAMGIETIFEANAEINYIPVNSVILVRMLGIILDNAIEELAELGEGQLFVACFKEKDAITFVVQNTCRAHLPKLRELQKTGFSTKGDGRGLGLNNLSELADSCPNVTLWTSIKENSFTQKLIIGEV